MKTYEVLKNFVDSQNGHSLHKKGELVDLSDERGKELAKLGYVTSKVSKQAQTAAKTEDETEQSEDEGADESGEGTSVVITKEEKSTGTSKKAVKK